ncbi:epoxide hydrolase N-terminal domain-containing protein [Bradyrhizobium sp. Pear76]|nr:epoxide hydrolase N-terminal domain-containing protein [Bradyrhizobium oropedii]
MTSSSRFQAVRCNKRRRRLPGVPLAMLQDLVRYWQADYDWRKIEGRLNARPQFKTEIFSASDVAG